jgi:hypothetical protein
MLKRISAVLLMSAIFAGVSSAQTWIRGQQVSISPKNVSLLVNETSVLKAYARTSTGVPVTKPGIEWVSRDTTKVNVVSKTNDQADIAARSEGNAWIIASWTTKSGKFYDSVLVVVNPITLGSLPWVQGQQLLLMPKTNTETFTLYDKDSVFLQGVARTSQGVLIADPLIQFQVDSAVGKIRRITNATAMFTVKNKPLSGVVPIHASWSTRSGVFRDSSKFMIQRLPDPTDVAIENVVIMQSAQNKLNESALIENRAALVRVFLRGSVSAIASPQVRVQLMQNGVSFKTVYPSGPTTIPVVQTPELRTSTWNVLLDSTDVRPNLQIKVDLQNHVDADVTNNRWPRSDSAFAVRVSRLPNTHIRFVPVFHAKSNRLGGITPATAESFLKEFRVMFPYSTLTYDIRDVYTTNLDTLRSNGSVWTSLLAEINILRSVESGNTMYYVGVVNVNYGSGAAGYAYIPGWASVVWDAVGTRGRVTAHELGHNMSRSHIPACGAANATTQYPYVAGRIGNVGWNYMTNTIVDTTNTDIMGYCSNQWTSDYTWNGVLSWRQYAQTLATPPAFFMNTDIIQVSGRIKSDTVMVDDIFRYSSTPTEDRLPSPYKIRLWSHDTILGVIPFTPITIDHNNEQHFTIKHEVSSTQVVTKLEVLYNNNVLNTQRIHNEPQDSVTVLRKDSNLVTINWNGNWNSALLIDTDSGRVLGTVKKSGDSIFFTNKKLTIILSKGLTNQTHLINLP